MELKKTNQTGVSLIELLVVMAIITTTLIALFAVLNYSLEMTQSQRDIVRANFLAQQSIEAVRNFRDNTDWDSVGLGFLTTGSIYHLEKTGTPPVWALLPGEQTIDGFTEKIVFSDVERDADDTIVESGGTTDDYTKKAAVTIEWTEKGQLKQLNLVGYFTNWQ